MPRNDQNHISKLFADSTGDNGLDFLKLLKNESLKTDSLVQTGPYVAMVLQVQDVEIGTSDTWVDEIKINFGAAEKDALKPAPNPLDNQRWVKVYARVTSDYLSGQPNIHSYIPMPKQLGRDEDLTNDVTSQRLIKMHHGFLGNLSEVTRPSPGDFIWVDFLDKRNFNKPVYIKKMLKTPSGAPCLDGTCPPNPFTKAPAKGQALNKVKGKNTNTNPNAPSNNPERSSLSPEKSPGPDKCRPNGKPYTLKGFRPTDFTTYQQYIKGEYKDNMEVTLCAMEVMAYHFENLYPSDKIVLKIPKNPGIAYPPQENTPTGKNRHHIGKAVDVAVYRNNTPIDKPLIWAAIMKLIMSGHLPDGGVGYFQTNANKGPNKGIKTTFSTNLPGSDWPHYDWDNSAGRPAKWIEATMDNSPVIFSSDALGKWGKASEWAAATHAGHTHMPASCMQALSDTATDPCPSLPTLQDVFAARKQAKAEEVHNRTRQTTVVRGLGEILSPGELSISTELPISKTARTIQFDKAFGRKMRNIGTHKDPILNDPDNAGLTPMELGLFHRRLEREFLDRAVSYPNARRPTEQCGLTAKGFFKMRDPVTSKGLEDIKRLGGDPNWPPGFVLDPTIMPQSKFKDKNGERVEKSALGDKLFHVSMFVIHETGVELNMTNQCIKRKSKILNGTWQRQKYAKPEEAYKDEIASIIKKERRKLYRAAQGFRKSYRKMKKGSPARAAAESMYQATQAEYKKWANNKDWAESEARKRLEGSAISALASGGVSKIAVQNQLRNIEIEIQKTKVNLLLNKEKYEAKLKSLQLQKQGLTAALAQFTSGNYSSEGVKKARKKWDFNKLWHFGMGRAGEIICMTPWNRYVAMSNWANNWAAGAELSCGHGGYVSTSSSRFKQYMKLGGKTLGQKNAFWGTVHPKNTKNFLQKELGVLGDTWQKGGQGRTVPNMTMMERQYQMIKWLDSHHNPFKNEFNNFDSTWYPCTINSPFSDFKTWSTLSNSDAHEKALEDARRRIRKKYKGFKTRGRQFRKFKKSYFSDMNVVENHQVVYNSNRPIFPWGRWSPKKMRMKGGSSQWKTRDLYGGRKTMTKKHWQKGVLCHARWGSHSDGVFIEYYCLGRELGLSPLAAFYACVGACVSQIKVLDPALAFKDPTLAPLPKMLVYFPTDPKADYVNLGRAVWEGNAALRARGPDMFSDAFGKTTDDAAQIIGQAGNPVDWSVRKGSLYDPEAMIPMPGASREIIKEKIGPGASQYLKKDVKGSKLLQAMIDSMQNPSEQKTTSETGR